MCQPSARALAYRPTERQLQAQIVEGLEALGFVVLQLGHISKQVRCQQCGHWQTPHVGYGNDPGAPDLLVSQADWPRGVGMLLEVKTPGYRTLVGTIPPGRLSAEQKLLADVDRIVIVRSLEDAVEALQGVRRCGT